MKIPGLDHPITVEPTTDHVVVRAGGRVVADSKAALVLREATLPAVYYIPIADVDQSAIVRSDHATYCPFKGDASYFDVVTADGTIPNAIWEYLEPYESVGAIAGHVAFYRHLVEISVG